MAGASWVGREERRHGEGLGEWGTKAMDGGEESGKPVRRVKCGLAVQKTQLPASETIPLTPASINHECYHREWPPRLKESLGITSDKRTLIITGITGRRTGQSCVGASTDDLHEALPQLSSGPPARTVFKPSSYSKKRNLTNEEKLAHKDGYNHP
ncbi:hypothetical protein E2C01_017077 [Portunus trituberculatus]|uniref:Uncharacterized protein n=1 Tax=Portunus trituberculatus TaxID=210409 RepID=A0A5B7DSU4_PORTR|nr:hypothetical protein [Portunus trituberculatus]